MFSQYYNCVEGHPKVGGLTPIASGVAFELMQDSTLILLNRQLFATEVIFRREIASLHQGGGSVSSLFV